MCPVGVLGGCPPEGSAERLAEDHGWNGAPPQAHLIINHPPFFFLCGIIVVQMLLYMFTFIYYAISNNFLAYQSTDNHPILLGGAISALYRAEASPNFVCKYMHVLGDPGKRK